MAEKIDLSSVSYVLGILSIVFAFFQPFPGLILGIIGYSQSRKSGVSKARKLNIIGIIVSVVFIIVLLISILFYSSELNSLFPQ